MVNFPRSWGKRGANGAKSVVTFECLDGVVRTVLKVPLLAALWPASREAYF